MDNAENRLSAGCWYAMRPAPAFASAVPDNSDYSLRRFEGGSPEILQPALVEHIVAIHLGGAKRVRRWQGGQSESFDVTEDSITLMPAGSPNRWVTDGPIHYAHLVISADLLREVAREEFGKDPGDLTLVARVGVISPVISSVLRALLRRIEAADAGPLYRQHAALMIVLDLLRNFSSLTTPGITDPGKHQSLATGGLAAWQLRRLVDYLHAVLQRDADASTMAQLIGVSRGHLFRAFKASTGATPMQFINRLRVDKAKALLRIDGMSLADVAKESGFRNERHLTTNIRLATGLSPRQFTFVASAGLQAPPKSPEDAERALSPPCGSDRHQPSAAGSSGTESWKAPQDGWASRRGIKR